MAVQEQWDEERIVAKSRFTAMNLFSTVNLFLRENSDYILRSRRTHSCSEIGKQDEKKFES